MGALIRHDGAARRALIAYRLVNAAEMLLVQFRKRSVQRLEREGEANVELARLAIAEHDMLPRLPNDLAANLREIGRNPYDTCWVLRLGTRL